MVDIPGNSTTDATISVGGVVDGDLETSGDQDWYRIELSAGQQVTIFLTGITLEDPYVRIRDSAGNIIFENDDISAGVIRDSRISFTASTGGTYYIDVGAWAPDEPLPGYTGTGTYQLSVQPYTPPPEYSIDQVAEFLASGYWNGDNHPFDVTQGGSISVNVTALTPAGQTLALTALGLWSDIIGVTFVQVTTGGQITFDDNEDGAFADNVWANGFSTSSHINVSVTWLQSYGTQVGGYAFQAYVHEIGHALGLGHAGYYNGTADYFSEAVFANDGWPMTVMSYFSQEESDYFRDQNFTFMYLATPMIGDIAAMQLLYGLSTTTRTGDTVYGFNSNADNSIYHASVFLEHAYTIFDSGGIDTLDYSGYATNQVINLNPETFSSIGGRNGNVSIGRGVTIENAIGGPFDDILIGNSANNVLDGREGVNTISYAYATSGVTIDTSITGPQNTIGAGIDTLLNYYMLIGSPFDDTLTGRTGNTVLIYAGAGNDILIPGADGDQLEGEDGDDWFISGPGHDGFSGGDGFDTVDYSQATGGVDTRGIAGADGDDRLHSIEQLIGSGYDDILSGIGASGVTVMIGGAGNDTLGEIFDAVRMEGGVGDDTYNVYGLLNDVIEMAGQGTDLVNSSISAYTLPANVENLVVKADYSGTGNELDNIITGSTGANILSGLAGNDQLLGKDGNDQLFGGAGNDVLTGGAGSDTLEGGEGSDIFRDSRSGLNGDTITDFATDDRLVFTDASLATFTYSVSGSTLTYSGGSLTLGGGVSGTLVAAVAPEGGVQLTLSAEPPPPTYTILTNSPTIVEGDSGTSLLMYTITLDRPAEQDVTITYATVAGGSAALNDDYSPVSGTLVIAAGETSTTVSVSVVGDVLLEGNETIRLQLSGEDLAATQTLTGTILNDDFGPAKLLLTESGQDFDIGGEVMIVGTTSGGEEIRVIRGDILLDASFNVGGDTVVLPDAAANYTAILSGSFVTITGGEISIAIPVGVNGLTVEFADAERSLRFDPGSGQVLLGTQAVTATAVAVAAATTPFTGDGPDSGPASVAKLLLTEPGQDIDVGGNVMIVGTTGGGEVMTILGGTIILDASFNIGGDTVVLPGNAASYSATLAGSFVTISGGDISIAIPVGTAGIDIQFSDTTEILRFDTSSGKVMLGDQPVSESSSSTAAALTQPSADKDAGTLYGLSLEEFEEPAELDFAREPAWPRDADHAPSLELHRFEFSESFTFG